MPGATNGTRYKFQVRAASGGTVLKADPMAFRTEVPPLSAWVVHGLADYEWNDGGWLTARANRDGKHAAVSIYEVHLGSWARVRR